MLANVSQEPMAEVSCSQLANFTKHCIYTGVQFSQLTVFMGTVNVFYFRSSF